MNAPNGFAGIPEWSRPRLSGAYTNQAPAEPDVHLLASKPDETWTIKVDRSTNVVCYQQPGHVRAGLTDAYCGPKIVHENANQLVAIEDRAFDVVRTIYFDKKKFTLMMTELDESNNTGASIQYFECY